MISKWISELCLQNSTPFSKKVVLELDAGSGLASISLFTHGNIFLNGTNQGPNQVVITDVNPFTLSNISNNVLLNVELFGLPDSACRSKNRDESQEFFDQLKNGNYVIQLFTPPSHYCMSPFLILSQDLYEEKFSEFTDASNFVMMRCQKY
ncbi:hypothetical protein PCYB_005780 [Plasmodium cynomolgi strain B]|uniref:Uncharacterized protein n=1 Tax=Plasmodium cynomolgi (strain B) TaxID=1120755 RepID=K6V0H3_PLACD|nr:hypothetical protein PCYB_005780 [Plasmodium cynomolgi strain B]GAB69829.1 hypothetical protein PCYB_005780 [Plasmodium cynomolgi strain B]